MSLFKLDDDKTEVSDFVKVSVVCKETEKRVKEVTTIKCRANKTHTITKDYYAGAYSPTINELQTLPFVLVDSGKYIPTSTITEFSTELIKYDKEYEITKELYRKKSNLEKKYEELKSR